ncbi:MAG: tRNA pseudouridine(55) synthase TruB [Lachnospiraceae bacterium]|nr:tRNA pseudouridine(55) synthase TruB [Lachnospiraceae bacterium]
MNGIINIYKEKGYTSHDVVAKLRGILKTKKIGHTGTLDPDATGVLPVCIGNATSLCDLLTDKIKIYDAEILFGLATDTEDISGVVMKNCPVDFTEEDLKNRLKDFIGNIQQVPPMYSAIKVNGKKLYELAREGIEVERKPRPVEIYEIILKSVTKENDKVKEARITVKCGKGTYIRSLCRDIGESLGSCACMKSLERCTSGIFDKECAVKLDEVERLFKEGKIEDILLPTEYFFKNDGSFVIKDEFKRFLLNGNKIFAADVVINKDPLDGNLFKAYTSDGEFKAVYSFDINTGVFSPYKMFLQ